MGGRWEPCLSQRRLQLCLLLTFFFFFFLADLRAVCAVHRGHRGAGAPNLACPHNEGSALHLPGGLPLLRRREEVSGQLAGSSAVMPSNRWRKSTVFFSPFPPGRENTQVLVYPCFLVFVFFPHFFLLFQKPATDLPVPPTVYWHSSPPAFLHGDLCHPGWVVLMEIRS